MLGYYQEAGGAVSFAMEASDSISFRVEDVGMDGLGAGDKIHLDFSILTSTCCISMEHWVPPTIRPASR